MPQTWVNDLPMRVSHCRPTKDPTICNNAGWDPGDHPAGCLPHQSRTSGRLAPVGACVDAVVDTSQKTASLCEHPEGHGPSIQQLLTNLATFKEKLSEQETLVAELGRATLTTITAALGCIQHPAIAIDRSGVVLDVNNGALQLFDCNLCIRNRRLTTNDRQASLALRSLVDRLSAGPDDKPLTIEPIIVRRKDKSTVVIRALPIHPAARSPFVAAGALLGFSVIEVRPLLDQGLLRRVFGLTPAEARLAALMGEGKALEDAAEKLGVKRETARNQLKAIFAKTETNRQGQLIALLSSLRPPV